MHSCTYGSILYAVCLLVSFISCDQGEKLGPKPKTNIFQKKNLLRDNLNFCKIVSLYVQRQILPQ